MSEEETGNGSDRPFNIEDLARMGMDEEGIFNFLHDAIGADVGTEVLREFSHSDHFAELLDVVTNSLSTGEVAKSRRESVDVSGSMPDTDANDKVEEVRCWTESLDVSNKVSDDTFDNVVTTTLVAEDEVRRELVEEKEIVVDIDKSDKIVIATSLLAGDEIPSELAVMSENACDSNENSKTPETFIDDVLEEAKDTEIDKGFGKDSISECILGVRDDSIDPVLLMAVEENVNSMTKDGTQNSEDSRNIGSNDLNIIDMGNEICGKHTETDNGLNSNQAKGRDRTGDLPTTSEKTETIKQKKTFAPFFCQEFSKFQNRFKLKHCSIILCDLLTLGSDYNNLLLHNKFVTDSSIDCLRLTKEQIKETLRLEKARRVVFSEKLNKILSLNIFPERSKQESQTKKHDENDIESKARDNKDGKNRSRFEVESDSDSSSDIQYIKRKSDSNVKKKDNDCRVVGEQTKGKAEYSAGGTRILPFERKRISEENRPRKFDKFERMFKEKSKGVKKENKSSPKVEPSVPEKTFASSSFRIPKKKDGQPKALERKVSVMTPLASQDIPSENLKFERYRKTKPNEDRHSKADNFPAKEGTTREAFINEHLKIELELPDEPDSFVGDENDNDGTTSQVAPLSDVKVGHLVLSVATFLRENPHVALPLTEDTATMSELLVVKIAWWFKKMDNDPSKEEVFIPELSDTVLPICDTDDLSDISFLGHVSNPEDETEECQINEVSSSSNRYNIELDKPQDPGKLDEFCGCALLQAKFRSAIGEVFQNVFDLRNGASYDKENFQAKCNLCNELIVGRTNLAVHIKKQEHRENLLNTSLKMTKSDEKSEVKNPKVAEVKNPIAEVKNDKIEKEKDSKGKEKERPRDKDKEKSVKQDLDQNGKTDKTDKSQGKVKPNKYEMERTKTSTGLPIKVPIMPGANRKRSRSKSRSPRRRKSKSPKSKSPHRRSPIELVVRSPQRHSPPRHRHKRRSRSPRKRSRSPRHLPINKRSRSPVSRRQRSTSIERVEEFLARTNRGRRSRSPSNNSKRQRRSRSRSPKPFIKIDNKEFHEKLALTVDGKWTADMEKKWNLMEAEQNEFLKRFQERQKQLNEKPEDHPNYAEEWTAFWEKRYQEVEKSGKDPDNYDYVVEWKEFWLKRVVILLQLEGEEKVEEIKKRYGMDYESLRKIRFAPVAETSLKVEVDSFLPAPSRIIVPSNVLNFPPPLSISDRGSDQMSRSMSISDDGHAENLSIAAVIPKREKPKRSNVTVEDIKSTWETLTGQKMGSGISGKSDAGSSSVESYDFDGFDLVQVLRLMCQIDQTLGIYAQQVQEFFKMAEELEISKRNKSYSLLNKKDFVELLFKCRDKFMNVIRANVVARDVLKSINLTVYALNAILDAPQCQQFKPSLDLTLTMELEPSVVKKSVEVRSTPQASPEVPVAQVKNENHLVNPSQVLPIGKPSVPENVHKSTISDTVAHLSLTQKKEIADIIAKALILEGRENISDSGLLRHLMTIFAPMLGDKSTTVSESDSVKHGIIGGRSFEKKGDLSTPLFPSSAPKKVEDLSIVVSRSAGTGIPPLPVVNTRVASPPPTVSHPLQNAVNPFAPSASNSRVSSQYHPYGGNRGFGRGRSSSPLSSGRRSPFSRRGYAGNPAPDSQDQDTDEDGSLSGREKRPNDIQNLFLNEAVNKLSNQLLNTNERSGLYSPPSSISLSSDDASLAEVPKSAKLPPGILNLIRKERSDVLHSASSGNHNLRNCAPTKDTNKVDNRRQRRAERFQREKRCKRSPSPSERKENSRDGRRKFFKERSKTVVDARFGRKRESRRRRRSRGSDSSGRSSRSRHSLQGTSQGVNSRVHQASPTFVERQDSKERNPRTTKYNECDVNKGVSKNTDQKAERGAPSSKRRKLSSTQPSRGVSAIFWETSSVSGTEGNGDVEAIEDAFTEDKIKARQYRHQKPELEPGEILSSCSEISAGDSELDTWDHRPKNLNLSKQRSGDGTKFPEIKLNHFASATCGSQDSFADFDECMTSEKLNTIDDLNTSYEDADMSPRKIQLDLPFCPGITSVAKNIQNDSDDSLTDFELPASPDCPKEVTDTVNKKTLTTASKHNSRTLRLECTSCEAGIEASSVKLRNKVKLQKKTVDISCPREIIILSDGELSDVTVDQNFEEVHTTKKVDMLHDRKSKTVEYVDDDALSKLSTISSGNIFEMEVDEINDKNASCIDENPDGKTAEAALKTDKPPLETEVKEFESVYKEIKTSESYGEVVSGKEMAKSCSQNCASVGAHSKISTSTNVDSEVNNVNNAQSQPQEFVISINKNIFETLDTSFSEDENEGDLNQGRTDSIIPFNSIAVSVSTDIKEKANNDRVVVQESLKSISNVKHSGAKESVVEHIAFLNTKASRNEKRGDNVGVRTKESITFPVGSKYLHDEVEAQSSQYKGNDDSSDTEDCTSSSLIHPLETKLLIGNEAENGLAMVRINGVDVIESVEVTEEFLMQGHKTCS